MRNKLDVVLDVLDDQPRDALLDHLQGGTSAQWIADTLTRHGHPISATTIKDWRRRNKREGSQ